jgi:protocatechuate 3,4-dioxygenase beta subunit
MNDQDPGNEHDHHAGLAHDVRRLVAMSSRRQALRLFASASLIPLFGCGGDDVAGVDAGTGVDSGGPATCANIPAETGGPYPGDGTNGANALTLSGIVRSDIRTSIGTASGTAAGVPLTIKLTLVNSGASCAPLAGYAIYLWHCDRDGKYSMYTIADQNYLRGVQETDASGTVTFTSIFPACYSGRWPHIHFEIYPSVAKATAAANRVHTSQLALPADVCSTVFATTGYEQSVNNFSQISLTSDNVFMDGSSLQVATVSGSVAAGYTASLTLAITV